MRNIGEVLEKLREVRARRVMLQVPEGLKPYVQEYARELEKSGIVVYISVEPCFGGCDIRDREAKVIGCDALVHVGHADFGLKPCIPVIYDEYRLDIDPVPMLTRNLKALKGFRRIALVSTVQYLGALSRAGAFLRKNGKTVLIGTPARGGHPGQVLGCDFSAAKSVERGADCVVFLGTGGFHPLGLAAELEKPVFFLDLESGELVDLANERLTAQKMRFARIAKAAEARNFGILVSTKPGQAHPAAAEKAKKRLESLGRRAWMLAADQVTPGMLLGLEIEAIVDTACPRITDDSRMFRKPVILLEDIDFIEQAESAK